METSGSERGRETELNGNATERAKIVELQTQMQSLESPKSSSVELRYLYPDIDVPMDLPRTDYLSEAKVAKDQRRFKRALKLMNTLIIVHVPPSSLTPDERLMLELVYRSVYLDLKTAFLTASAREHVEGPGPASLDRSIAEREITEVCRSIFYLIDEKLLPSVLVTEDQQVVGDYLRIRADFNVYLSFVASVTAYNAYNASGHALLGLPPSDPVLLKWALKYSIFVHRILRNPDGAIQVAEKAYTKAAGFESVLAGERMPESSIPLVNSLCGYIGQWRIEKFQAFVAAAAAHRVGPTISNAVLQKLALMTAAPPDDLWNGTAEMLSSLAAPVATMELAQPVLPFAVAEQALHEEAQNCVPCWCCGAGPAGAPCCCGPAGAATAHFCLANGSGSWQAARLA